MSKPGALSDSIAMGGPKADEPTGKHRGSASKFTRPHPQTSATLAESTADDAIARDTLSSIACARRVAAR